MVATIGINLALWLHDGVTNNVVVFSYALFFIFSCWGLLKALNKVNMPDWAFAVWLIIWLLILPIAAMMLFPHSTSKDSSVWAMSLLLSLLVGLLA